METAQHKPLMAEEPTTPEGEQVLDALCSVSFDPRYLSISILIARLLRSVKEFVLQNWITANTEHVRTLCFLIIVEC